MSVFVIRQAPNVLDQCVATAIGHDQVGDDDVRAHRREQWLRVRHAPGGDDRRAVSDEQVLQQLQRVLVIVDEEQREP